MKRTRKKSQTNKKSASGHLERIAKNVIKRGVYLVKADATGWRVVNAYTDAPVMQNIPERKLADCVADRYNSGKRYPPKKAASIIEHLSSFTKLQQNCVHYLYVIANTSNEDLRLVTEMRLYYDQQRLEKAIQDISRLIMVGI